MSKEIDILLAYPKPTTDSPLNLTPLSILYPGALFEVQGQVVAYFDARFDPPELFDDLVKESKELGVSAFTGYQTGEAVKLLKRAKEIKPKIITGLGGHHARLCHKDVLREPFVDKVWTKASYGEDLFPYNERTRILFQRTDFQYFTSRGCPHVCTFCALSSPWIPKDLTIFDREMHIIYDGIGFKEVSLSDPNIAFGTYRSDGKAIRIDRVERINKIGETMRSLGVRWDGNMRAPYLTPEMVEALERSNCYSLEIGCESGNDEYLKKIIKKGHGINSIRNAAKNVSRSNISIMYSFIAQGPGETPEMLRDTMDLVDEIVDTDPHSRISIYTFAPYPGSPLYEAAIEGKWGYPKFKKPESMEEWGKMKLMHSPLYWITGLCFRLDNTKKNFQGQDWGLIQPYVELAEKKWKSRDIDTFPCEEVEQLIAQQREKNLQKGENQVDAAKLEI